MQASAATGRSSAPFGVRAAAPDTKSPSSTGHERSRKSCVTGNGWKVKRLSDEAVKGGQMATTRPRTSKLSTQVHKFSILNSQFSITPHGSNRAAKEVLVARRTIIVYSSRKRSSSATEDCTSKALAFCFSSGTTTMVRCTAFRVAVAVWKIRRRLSRFREQFAFAQGERSKRNLNGNAIMKASSVAQDLVNNP